MSWKGAAGIILALWGWWPLCDQTLKPLCHPAKRTLCQACHFQSGFTLPRHIHPLLFILCPSPILFFSVIFPSPFFKSLFLSLWLQLPSPTAMSTALRGISCYLREVTARLPCLSVLVCVSTCLNPESYPISMRIKNLYCKAAASFHAIAYRSLHHSPSEQNVLLFTSDKCWNKVSYYYGQI